MYEVEIKAKILDKKSLTKKLKVFKPKTIKNQIYFDTYFDDTNNSLQQNEKELRLRRIASGKKSVFLLTYKNRPFDLKSKSKEEFETIVSDFNSTTEIIRGLGFHSYISFEKYCDNYDFTYSSHDINVTVVELPNSSEKFIEISTLVKSKKSIRTAFSVLYDLLDSLQISRTQLTNEYYSVLAASLK